jgi:hypothetical protein
MCLLLGACALASVYTALLRLFECFRVRNFHPRFLALPDPTRPDLTRPKFLLPTTRHYFSLPPSPHLFTVVTFHPPVLTGSKTINLPLLVTKIFHPPLFYFTTSTFYPYYLLSLFLLLLLFTHLLWLAKTINFPFFLNDFSFFSTKLFHEPFFFTLLSLKFFESFYTSIFYLYSILPLIN